MKKLLLITVALAGGLMSCTSPEQFPEEITMSRETLMDKIKGGWAGQTIGVTYGGPTEFKYRGTMIQDYTPIKYQPGCVKWWYENGPGLYDDVYMDLTFVEVFERLGLDAPVDSFAVAYANADYPLWHANQSARYNILNGIMPPMSGHWTNNPHADDIDFQIEADYAGLMAPGMINAAVGFTDGIGHIMNCGDGWYGGAYVAAMYSLAFICDDVETIVKEALKVIPAESRFHRCISDVIRWHSENPDDWKQTWFECEKKWSTDIGCTDGVFQAFNIDAVINSAYVVIGLLYGEGDFYKSMDIATRCGQDSDCNPATAAGIIGTMKGYSAIPDRWLDNIKEVEDLNFKYTEISLNKAYELSFGHALQVIGRNGGKVDAGTVTIRPQQPEPLRLEQCFEGHFPIDQISLERSLKDGVEVEFSGNGLNASYWLNSPDCTYTAEVEVMLDGEKVETVKLPADHHDRKNDLFYRFNLEDKEHHVSFRWMNPREDVRLSVNNINVYAPSGR